MKEPFYYDPDYRSKVHPKDRNAPYCCRCQRNVDTSKAIAVTINEETMMAVIGHDRDPEVIIPNPHNPELISNSWLGKDCLRALQKEHASLTNPAARLPGAGACERPQRRSRHVRRHHG